MSSEITFNKFAFSQNEREAVTELMKQDAIAFTVWCQLEGYHVTGYDDSQLNKLYKLYKSKS